MNTQELLAERASAPCAYSDGGGIPCPQEWPDDQSSWCAPCFARYLLLATRRRFTLAVCTWCGLGVVIDEGQDWACGNHSDAPEPEIIQVVEALGGDSREVSVRSGGAE